MSWPDNLPHQIAAVICAVLGAAMVICACFAVVVLLLELWFGMRPGNRWQVVIASMLVGTLAVCIVLGYVIE